MIRLAIHPMDTVHDVQGALQKAIELEFSTLPPYLYALFTLSDGSNDPARRRITAVAMEEMTHMALACNILNAIGGAPVLADVSVVPTYPGPLPYDIGEQGGQPLVVSLLPFSKDAITQAMRIEEPEDRLVFPEARDAAPTYQTIGQFYAALDTALAELPAAQWAHPPRNQLKDHPFLAGQLFEVADYASASRAIERIVTEGEGTQKSPLDFEGHVAHYYRFEEVLRDRVLQKDPSVAEGFTWGPPLGVDWAAVTPAIADPADHNFSGDPDGQAAQDECDRCFTHMVQELDRSVNGDVGRLGGSVRAMFDLRMAARAALAIPLKGSGLAAGPAFRYRPELV